MQIVKPLADRKKKPVEHGGGLRNKVNGRLDFFYCLSPILLEHEQDGGDEPPARYVVAVKQGGDGLQFDKVQKALIGRW